MRKYFWKIPQKFWKIVFIISDIKWIFPNFFLVLNIFLRMKSPQNSVKKFAKIRNDLLKIRKNRFQYFQKFSNYLLKIPN